MSKKTTIPALRRLPSKAAFQYKQVSCGLQFRRRLSIAVDKGRTEEVQAQNCCFVSVLSAGVPQAWKILQCD